MKHIQGSWPENDLRRAFVEGAKWWEWTVSNATMWQSDIRAAEAEAEKRYPNGLRITKVESVAMGEKNS